MMYTNSHVGLCLWQTKVGHMHASLKGRDFFGEVVEQCRRHRLHPIAYFSVVFDNWNFEHHPDWRIVRADGEDGILQSRYGVVCPNSPYREYVQACMREIVGNYDIEGIFFDMTFWPSVCYCPHCTDRFRREQNAEPPRVVDWDDPTWRAFQQARERWLLDFAQTATAAVKKVRPITVQHQYSTIFHNWTLGVPLKLREACDYVGGDFYGGPTQHSLVCKAYFGLTPTRPFEFRIGRTTPGPHEHVTTKPFDQLRTESFVATIHSAALTTIDYINADGTLNPEVFKFGAPINRERAPYEPFLGGELVADVAIYYDKESMYNPAENGVHITKLRAVDKCPHRDAVVGAARILRGGHFPFGLVTNANLELLNKSRAVILPNVLELTADQAVLFRDFVARGGTLYASGPSSLDRFDKNGPRFLLEDVLGVRYRGTLGTKITYLAPTDAEVSKALWPQDYLTFLGPMIQAEALPGSQVVGTVTLPFVAPELGHAIGSHFAAIHSNPPALTPGSDPAIVVHSFGRGRAIWVAAPIESADEVVNARLVSSLLRRVLPEPLAFEVDAHPGIEMTLFHQAENHRFVAGLLNMEMLHPPIPAGATVRVRVPSGNQATRVARLPGLQAIPFDKVGPYVQFRLEPFEAVAMALIEYQ